MSPPGGAATLARPGCTTEPRNSGPFLVDFHRLMTHHNIAIGQRRANAIVQGFLKRIADWTVPAGRMSSLFGDWLEHKLDLTIEQRRALEGDPDWSRCISYADPVGEEAVRNVLKFQHR